MGEVGWSAMHWIGMRNLAVIIGWLPGFSTVNFFAQSKHLLPRHVAITIDDVIGDNASGFEQLLSLLHEHSVNATFFVIGNENTISETRWPLLRQAASLGHEIANHGVEDARMNNMDQKEFEVALDEWELRMRNILPQWPMEKSDWKWFRPPQGLMSPVMANVLEERGYRVALTDVYSDDWLLEDASFHVRVIDGATCDGSIVILHVPDRKKRLQTLEILRTAIPLLRARGFEFLRLSDLFCLNGDQSHGCYACVFTLLLAVITLLPAMFLILIFVVSLASRFPRYAWREATSHKKCSLCFGFLLFSVAVVYSVTNVTDPMEYGKEKEKTNEVTWSTLKMSGPEQVSEVAQSNSDTNSAMNRLGLASIQIPDIENFKPLKDETSNEELTVEDGTPTAIKEEKVVKYRCDTVPTYDADDASTCGGGSSHDSACFTLHKGANWQCFQKDKESLVLCKRILVDGKKGFYKGACVFKGHDDYLDAIDAHNLKHVVEEAKADEEPSGGKEARILRNLKWRWAEHRIPGVGNMWPRAGIEDRWNMPADRAALVKELEAKMQDPKAVAKQYETRAVEFADVDFPERRRTFADFTKALQWLTLASNIQSRDDL